VTAPETHRPGVLTVTAEVYDAMVAHCRVDAPNEACGLLAGVHPVAGLFYPLANSEASPTRYNADPQELIRAYQDLRAREAEILAIYHSHPASSPLPSRTDLRTNHYGDLPRVIVSLVSEPPEVRVWRLDAESYREVPWRLDRGPVAGVEPGREAR